MGRASTGAWTVYESTRLELSWLIKNRYIQKNCITSSNLTWSNQHGEKTASIGFRSSYIDDTGLNNFIEVQYSITSRNGEKQDYKYQIKLFEQPSNLGKGNVLYFICPNTGRRCRILYLAYGSGIFASRKAYRSRLYYDCQRASKLSKYNDSYWRLENHLSKLKKRACQGSRIFKGKLTKASERYNRLYGKQMEMEKLRWTLGLPQCLLNSVWKDYRG